MKLKMVVVDFELPAHTRRWLLRLGIPSVVVVGAAALAFAGVPKRWNAREPLRAEDLNANFADLDKRVAALDARARFVGSINGRQYSVGATSFVKETSTGGPHLNGTYDGAQVGGHTGAKEKCEAAVGSASAHMCTGDEIVRSAAAGIAPPAEHGWYAGAYRSNDKVTPDGPVVDCDAYTINIPNNSGPMIGKGGWVPSYSPCSIAQRILCCD